MTEYAAAGAIGFAFGWLLQKAGLSRYERIVGVYRFTDLAVLKFLLTALVTGAAMLQSLASLRLTTAVPVPSTVYAGNFGGGVLFGIGMAASGFCPGTVAAGAGEGRLDYLVPGVLGMMVGTLSFGVLYPAMFALASRVVQPDATLPGLLGVNPWLVIALLAELSLLLFYAVEHRERRD